MNKYLRYEQEKKEIQKRRLSPKEYEREIQKIAKRLGL